MHGKSTDLCAIPMTCLHTANLIKGGLTCKNNKTEAVEPGHFQLEVRSVMSDHNTDGQKHEQKTATMKAKE